MKLKNYLVISALFLVSMQISYGSGCNSSQCQVASFISQKGMSVGDYERSDLKKINRKVLAVELALHHKYNLKDLKAAGFPQVAVYVKNKVIYVMDYVNTWPKLYFYRENSSPHIVSASNWCRDREWVLKGWHKGDTCFRDGYSSRSWMAPQGQICFQKSGYGYDSWDKIGFAKKKRGSYYCKYNMSEAPGHIASQAPYVFKKVKSILGSVLDYCF
mgnify:CR=1 FL=1